MPRHLLPLLFSFLGPLAVATELELFGSDLLQKGSDNVKHWQKLAAANYPQSHYEAVEANGVLVLKATSQGGATGYWRDLTYSLQQSPEIGWSWKIVQTPDTSWAGDKDGDDFAVRLFVGFDHRSRPSLLERARQAFANRAFGRTMPRRTLIYVWESEREEAFTSGTIVDSPYNDRSKYIVLTEGEKGEWLHFRRNVFEDYRNAFGETPHSLMGIGIMTDADNGKGRAEAFYGSVVRFE